MNIKLLTKNYCISKIFSFLIAFFPKKNNFIKSSNVGVVTLLCHSHTEMFIYALKSLFYQLQTNLPVLVIDDGTLTNRDVKMLYSHFDLTIKPRHNADKEMSLKLINHAAVHKYRFDINSPPTKQKLDAYLLTPFKRTLYLDSDIIFYRTPTLLKSWIFSESNISYYMVHPRKEYKLHRQDIDYSFRLLLKRFHLEPLHPSFNSGLLAFTSDNAFDLNLLNKVFELFNRVSYSYAFTAEETAISIVYKKIHALPLPSEIYTCIVNYEEFKKASAFHSSLIHFIGESEELYKSQAVKLALRSRLFH